MAVLTQDMLEKRDRGRGADMSAVTLAYGQSKGLDRIPGAHLLKHWPSVGLGNRCWKAGQMAPANLPRPQSVCLSVPGPARASKDIAGRLTSALHGLRCPVPSL